MKKGKNDSSAESKAIHLSDVKSRIEMRLQIKMRRGETGMRPVIGLGLIEDIADWGIWMRDRDSFAGGDNWHVEYLQWALLGRCKEFMGYCSKSDHPRAPEAIQAVQKVYDFVWPHNAISGYLFHSTWGWLQLELEKPGESKPMSIQEQKDFIEKALKERGVPILDWFYDGFGGVQAITGRQDDQNGNRVPGINIGGLNDNAGESDRRIVKRNSAKGKLLNLNDAIENLPEKVRLKLEKSKESETASFKRSVVIPIPREFRAERPTLYYRVSPANNGLVFAEPERAEYIAGIHDALQNAKTWGEFKAKLDPEEYERMLVAHFDENDEPRPKDADPFDAEHVPGYCGGDYPSWLQQEMNYCLPEDILERYATDTATRLNGNYYHIDEEHEEAICIDLRMIGFKVTKREDLYFY